MADVASLIARAAGHPMGTNLLRSVVGVVSLLTQQLVTFAQSELAFQNGAASNAWWWPSSQSNGGYNNNVQLYVLLGMVWLLSVSIIGCFSCLTGCCAGMLFRETVCDAAKCARSGLSSWCAPPKYNKPVNAKLEALFSTASFIEGGGQAAVDHVAGELGASREDVQSWFTKWQLAKEGPRRLQM